jgi:hypothetical protein
VNNILCDYYPLTDTLFSNQNINFQESHQRFNGKLKHARVVYHGSKHVTNQIKAIGIFCFCAKHAALRSNSKEWLARIIFTYSFIPVS